MADISIQNQAMASDSLTPIPQAPTVMQQPIQQLHATEVELKHQNKDTLYGLGTLEVILGSISMIFGIATLIIAASNIYEIVDIEHSDSPTFYSYYSHNFTWVSQGVWGGLFIIATGILGIKAKNNPSVRMYNANMAMSIVTANIMVALMAISGMAAGFASTYYYTHRLESLIALHIILVVVGFVAAVVCMVHSAFCCVSVCCHRTPYIGPVTYTPQPFSVQQPQQMVRLANGEYMLVPAQPGFQCHPIMADPMNAGQPAEGILPQTMMSEHTQFVHETTEYPPLGSQQPVQVTTVTNAPSQGPTDVPHRTSATLLARDINKVQPQ